MEVIFEWTMPSGLSCTNPLPRTIYWHLLPLPPSSKKEAEKLRVGFKWRKKEECGGLFCAEGIAAGWWAHLGLIAVIELSWQAGGRAPPQWPVPGCRLCPPPHANCCALFCSTADHTARHPGADPTQTHPRRGGGHPLLQVQAVLQRCTGPVCLHRWVTGFTHFSPVSSYTFLFLQQRFFARF